MNLKNQMVERGATGQQPNHVEIASQLLLAAVRIQIATV